MKGDKYPVQIPVRTEDAYPGEKERTQEIDVRDADGKQIIGPDGKPCTMFAPSGIKLDVRNYLVSTRVLGRKSYFTIESVSRVPGQPAPRYDLLETEGQDVIITATIEDTRFGANFQLIAVELATPAPATSKKNGAPPVPPTMEPAAAGARG